MWMSEAKGAPTKVHEDLIAEGARVYVLGKARPERIGDSVSEKIKWIFRPLKKDQKRLMEYDTNNNGRLDPEEWDIARNDAENIVYAEMLANGGQKERVVIGRPGLRASSLHNRRFRRKRSSADWGFGSGYFLQAACF
jgi:hypothetical protein